MSYLLDTNVVSEMTKRTRNPNLQAWLDAVNGPTLYLSVLVLGEIRKGVELLRRRDVTQAGAYESWLDRLQREFRTRILPVTLDVAEEWGRMNAKRPLPVVDGLIAATASAHGWILVTRNVKDFADLDVKMVDPFAWSA
ncbi:type II toxin-antitoxin system VapC family toxin [Nonomuraea sp. RK-328]|uniref:Ribonuclease VapC n=1 Tax=Nonomuraea montanisoli TaxID=2741721 RepID=A0A7Y6M6U3_9ACTN|nr:type II toxin-antitoxin system VapC family toxin [Nonomuraea montanisoli]MBN6052306.1 type II toxin-antitoxin system VapC family toxin [Nonomuraea sp. RK-328]NUW37293.1 type II toxin-antitoxin system VapC family toxin [Nonomuraea montanisoli]